MYFSVFRNSKSKDVAIDVINFLANDPEAGTILGTDRGLPSNLDIRAAVASTTKDAAMKQSISVENDLGKLFGAPPPVPPEGAQHAAQRAGQGGGERPVRPGHLGRFGGDVRRGEQSGDLPITR